MDPQTQRILDAAIEARKEKKRMFIVREDALCKECRERFLTEALRQDAEARRN